MTICSVVNTAYIFMPGGWPFWLSGLFALISITSACGFYGSAKRTVAKREEEREERWKEWLSKPIPELEPPINWAEIERATEHLILEGKEPTYERARDWLRVESAQRK
jgi:hypothetical protein